MKQRQEIAGADGREFLHRVDESNRIVFVNQAWQDFAVENRMADLNRQLSRGPVLWEFITDQETRYIFELMLAKVRRGEGELTVPFRCDAPDLRRFMELSVSLTGEGMVDFSSRVLRSERREPVSLLMDAGSRSQELLISCSWCKKVEFEPGGWAEVELAVMALKLFAYHPLPRISHGICPECSRNMEEMIG